MRKLAMSLLLVLTLTYSVFATQGIDDKKIKIGSFMPLTGALAHIGQGVKDGMEAYINYYNAEIAKEIGGRIIEAIIIDDQFVAEKSIQAVKKLVEQDEVFALVGTIGTPGVVANLGYVTDKGIPWVYQGTGVRAVYDPPRRNIFMVQPSYISEGRVFIKFLADQLKKKKVVVVYQNDEAGQAILEGINSILPEYKKKGVTILRQIPVDRTMNDFSPVANQIKQLNPEAVIVFAFFGLATNVVKACREAAIDIEKTPFITTYINSDPAIFKVGGQNWEGVICGSWANTISEQGYNFFVEKWKKYSGKTGDPTYYNVGGWIAMDVFVEGLKRAAKRFGKVDWNNFIKAMETFHENGGFSGGMVYRLNYKPFKANDPSCRFPQSYLYFMKAIKGQYEPLIKSKNPKDHYISAY